MNAFSVILIACFLIGAHAFSPAAQYNSRPITSLQQEWGENFDGGAFGGDGEGGGIEEIEFKIYPDGRIEEIVRDVKGAKCTEITASINKHLGDVTHTEATTEMFEQPLVVDQKVNVKAQGGWDGSSTW